MKAHRPLVIIPARGGSKGIPHKNIVDFCGRPLIAHSIDAARWIADDRHIILSTDDEAIAEAAEAEGLATTYRRPACLATDTAGSREVIIDAMDWADSQGIDYDFVVLLQPTSPLRERVDLEGAIDLYSPEIDMVVSVKDAASNPYYNCFEPDADGYLRVSKGDGLYTRRQDAPAAYEYNGSIYVINPESVRKMPFGKFPRRIPYPMPAERSVDIDTPTDLIVAEAIAKQCSK